MKFYILPLFLLPLSPRKRGGSPSTHPSKGVPLVRLGFLAKGSNRRPQGIAYRTTSPRRGSLTAARETRMRSVAYSAGQSPGTSMRNSNPCRHRPAKLSPVEEMACSKDETRLAKKDVRSCLRKLVDLNEQHREEPAVSSFSLRLQSRC